MNTSDLAVLREIHRARSATRVDLVGSTQLSSQSLTRITKKLIDDGLIVEGERRISGRGKPAIFLSICPNIFMSFGLVIEHDQITCVAFELGGEQLFYLKRRGNYKPALNALAEADAMLATAIAESPRDAYALGVGVSVSGFFLEEKSRRLVSKNDIEGWQSINLGERLDLPVEMPVFVENDGRAAALGQAVNGIGRRIDSFFLVLMTKGIGGGFVQDGRLIRGRLGNAGEVGQFLKGAPSTQRPTEESLTEFLRKKWGACPSYAEIDSAVLAGDPVIAEWLEGAARSLEPALYAVTALLDPRAIILAGRLSPTLRQGIAERTAIQGVYYSSLQAPTPTILVDPNTDCLTIGAASLPVADFLYR